MKVKMKQIEKPVEELRRLSDLLENKELLVSTIADFLAKYEEVSRNQDIVEEAEDLLDLGVIEIQFFLKQGRVTLKVRVYEKEKIYTRVIGKQEVERILNEEIEEYRSIVDRYERYRTMIEKYGEGAISSSNNIH